MPKTNKDLPPFKSRDYHVIKWEDGRRVFSATFTSRTSAIKWLKRYGIWSDTYHLSNRKNVWNVIVVPSHETLEVFIFNFEPVIDNYGIYTGVIQLTGLAESKRTCVSAKRNN